MTKRPASPPEQDHTTALSAELQVVFGESLRTQRTQAGMTQAELAARSGFAQETISRIESGTYNLTLRTMSRLAALLDGEVADMLRRVKDTRNPS